MTDHGPYIVACGVPPMLVEACKALGLYLPVKVTEESKLEHLRPEAWIVSAAVFAAHLDFLMPYRKHVLVYVGEEKAVARNCVSLNDTPDRWAEAFACLEREGSAFGENNSAAPLTQREKAGLRLISAGLTAKEIASELGISANTVVTHRKNISAKLGIRSASGLSLYAMMNGII
mgnify:FL=1